MIVLGCYSVKEVSKYMNTITTLTLLLIASLTFAPRWSDTVHSGVSD